MLPQKSAYKTQIEKKKNYNNFPLRQDQSRHLHDESISDPFLPYYSKTGTNLLHWINTVTLGAVIIILLRNKYDKLYKNIHLDNQLGRGWVGVETERKVLQQVCVCYVYVHVCTRGRVFSFLVCLFILMVISVFSEETVLSLSANQTTFICLPLC